MKALVPRVMQPVKSADEIVKEMEAQFEEKKRAREVKKFFKLKKFKLLKRKLKKERELKTKSIKKNSEKIPTIFFFILKMGNRKKTQRRRKSQKK